MVRIATVFARLGDPWRFESWWQDDRVADLEFDGVDNLPDEYVIVISFRVP